MLTPGLSLRLLYFQVNRTLLILVDNHSPSTVVLLTALSGRLTLVLLASISLFHIRGGFLHFPLGLLLGHEGARASSMYDMNSSSWLCVQKTGTHIWLVFSSM